MIGQTQVSQTRQALGSDFEFRVNCAGLSWERAERALDRVHVELRKLDRELNEEIPESPFFRLSRASPNEAVPLGPHAVALLEQTQELVRVWPALKKLLHGYRFHPQDRVAFRVQEEAQISLTAIARGYVLDLTCSILEQEGIQNFFLTANRKNVLLRGSAPDGNPWDLTWDWRDPSKGAANGCPLAYRLGDPIAISAHWNDQCSALVGTKKGSQAEMLALQLGEVGWNAQWAEQRDIAIALKMRSEAQPRWNGHFQALFDVLKK